MKISVEIKNDTFEYEIEIGSSKRNGSMPFSVDSFLLLASLVEHLNKHTMNTKKDTYKAWEAYIFSQAYPDLMKEVERKIKKK